MSDYNSENCEILAMRTEQGFHPNTRMLLLHATGCPERPFEYIVGSYFTVRHYDGALGYERYDYSWDWGHYFWDFVEAAEYWKNEVIGGYQAEQI